MVVFAHLAIGSKVAYVADGIVGEPGTPVGMIIAGLVRVTMPDYMMPGPPPPGWRRGDDDRTDLAWIVYWDGQRDVDAIWVNDSYLVPVPYDTQYVDLTKE